MVTVLERPGRRCGATNRQGERCGNLALRGQRVCRFHGGKSPQAKTAAARREVERKAFDALARHKAVPIDNPLEAFRQLAGEVVAVKDWLGGIVEKVDDIRYQGGSGEQLRGELQAYTGLLDQCRRVLADYGRLNIDERLTAIDERLMEQYAQQAYAGLQLALPFLMPDEFRTVALAVVAHVLRSRGPDGVPAPTGETAEHLARWQAHLAAAGRAPEAERELAMVRRELEAVRAHRDDLLDVVRRNRSAVPLAIEGPKAPDVVVDRETITVPDPEPAAMSTPVEPHEVLPPAKSSSRSGRMHFRSPQSSSPAREPDPWERFGYRSPGP